LESARRWKRQSEIDDGMKDGLTGAEQSELVELRLRARRLKQENDILRRAPASFAKDAAPTRCARWSVTLPRRGSPWVGTCRVLGFSTQAFYRWGKAPCSPATSRTRI
jgi:hypothetical protein